MSADATAWKAASFVPRSFWNRSRALSAASTQLFLPVVGGLSQDGQKRHAVHNRVMVENAALSIPPGGLAIESGRLRNRLRHLRGLLGDIRQSLVGASAAG